VSGGSSKGVSITEVDGMKGLFLSRMDGPYFRDTNYPAHFVPLASIVRLVKTSGSSPLCTNCRRYFNGATDMYYPVSKNYSGNSWICRECAVEAGFLW